MRAQKTIQEHPPRFSRSLSQDECCEEDRYARNVSDHFARMMSFCDSSERCHMQCGPWSCRVDGGPFAEHNETGYKVKKCNCVYITCKSLSQHQQHPDEELRSQFRWCSWLSRMLHTHKVPSSNLGRNNFLQKVAAIASGHREEG